MAWRIHDEITHGEIDNRKAGQVEGRIWVIGSDEPIHLRLKGNCWSDLAGCYLKFRNPNPDPNGRVTLNPNPEGVVGDMTATRKVQVPTGDHETLSYLVNNNQPIPTQLGNSIYLEWFSEANGRVVVEAAHYQCEVSPPEWSMDVEEEKEQRKKNEESLQEFLQNLVNQQSLLDSTDGEDEEPLDEFQWEQLLRQSDKISDQYLEALEKYRDDPDCDRLIAEEMGWDWLIEENDLPLENPLFEFVKEATGEEIGEFDSDDDDEIGEINDEPHPLAERFHELASRLFENADERGLLESHENILLPLLTCTSAAAAQLGGALDALAADDYPDYGFMIASLKRSLTPLHQSIAAADRASKSIPEESEWIEPARKELFLIRQEILTLMDTFRKRLHG